MEINVNTDSIHSTKTSTRGTHQSEVAADDRARAEAVGVAGNRVVEVA